MHMQDYGCMHACRASTIVAGMFLMYVYCTNEKTKLCISISCPILVLSTVFSHPRHADAKNDLKIYKGSGPYPQKIQFENNFPHTFFFKFDRDYDRNLYRYLNPELPPMRDSASLYFLNCHTFVCGTSFPEIKLN